MEKTLKTYVESDQSVRIQLVYVRTPDTHFNQYHMPVGSRSYYEVRKNRRISYKSESFNLACNHFKGLVIHSINTLNLF